MNYWISMGFPLWATIFALTAYRFPVPFIQLKSWIIPLLGIIMLAMGMTLTLDDFLRVARRPLPVAAGLILQYSLMPLAAWAVARALNLSAPVTVGLVLVGCCPGGTGSNVISYLADADVALSITCTCLSTMVSFLMTPALAWLYLDKVITVPAAAMTLTILKIVVLPVVAGVAINSLAGPRLLWLKKGLPPLAVTAICLIIAIIVGLNKAVIATAGPRVVTAVILHNLMGLWGGYLCAWAMGFPLEVRRTLAIEVGMQNSGLAVALAMKFFAPLSALAGALFSIWHNISGSMAAVRWGKGCARER